MNMILRNILAIFFITRPFITFCIKNVALVIYEEDLRDVNQTYINNNLSAIDSNTQANYYTLKKTNSSYQKVLNSSMVEMLKKNDFVISFLSGKESQVLHEILDAYDARHFSLSPEDCHLEYNGNIHGLENCASLSSEVKEALFILFRHLNGAMVAIISSNELCSLSFSKQIVKELSQRNILLPTSQKTTVSEFFFSGANLNIDEIRSSLKQVNVLKPKVIILVSPGEIQEIIFQVAATHQLLGYNNIWIVPGIKDTINKSLVPMQVIAIRRTIESRERSMLSSDQIIMAVKYGNEMMACDAKRRKQVRLNQLSTSFPCRSNHYSKVTVLAKSDRQSNWTIVYMKDQRSPYKYYTNNGIVLSLFANDAPTAHFRVVTIIDAPFTMEMPYLVVNEGGIHRCESGIICRLPESVNRSVNTNSKWRYSCCIGHSIDLLNILMKRLSFSVDLYVVEDGFYGSLVNGSFNGMIGDVARGTADIAIAGLTITSLRSTAVDFTSPFIRQDVGIVTMSKKKELEFINWQFVYPVDTSVIITVFLGILLGTFLTYVMENQEIVLKRLVNPKEFPPRYFWREGFTYYSGLTFQRDLGGKNPAEFGSRVVAIGFAFAMLVIMTTYTAVLTATKVSQKDPNPFLGIKDGRMTNPTPDFKFATVPSTSIESLFKNAPDENFFRMYLFMQKYNVKTVEEGIKQLRSGQLQAFIHEYPFLLYFLSKQSKCEMQITGEPIGQSGFGLALKKGSVWTDRLSFEILKLKESGQLIDLDKKWLATACLEKTNSMFAAESLSLEYFGGLVLFVSISFASMFFLLPLEYAYRKYPRKPIDAIANRLSNWKHARRQKMSLRARPKLQSMSSEVNFANIDMDPRPITIL